MKRAAGWLGLPSILLLLAVCTYVASTPTDLYITPDDVLLYPGPGLYTGDRVTFDVIPRNLDGIGPSDVLVRIYHQTPDGAETVAEGRLGYHTFDGVPRARMTWAWDTEGLEGEQHLTVWVDPDDHIQEGDENPHNNSATIAVYLHPAAARGQPEASATWTTTTTQCCTLHYLTSTAAERDLHTIGAEADEALSHVQSTIHITPTKRLELYLVSRTIGQGGYVTGQGQIILSYLDRNYAGRDIRNVLRHEFTHALDALILVNWPPTLLREGLAVWATGGHFKPEPIPERASALLQLGWYVPLDRLADDFYNYQHEVSYLEGAGLVAYLVEVHGWEGFLRFYTSFNPSGTAAGALDAALVETFGVGLEETEDGFLRWLEAHPPTPDQVRDLEVTVHLFDTVRRYQQVYEPVAYFWSGWLPNPAEAESRGIVADFIRHPRDPENVALETMLIAAQDALVAGEFDRAEALLGAVNHVLDRGVFTDPLAAEYLEIVRTVAAAGYEAQWIELDGPSARVRAIADWPDLVELRLGRTADGWVLGD